ncbi:MAG: tetratricopeptide (TPR) repeat protein [Lysobacterales bacterium]|jgi:tetratricopeptide (TPR) repeat protein
MGEHLINKDEEFEINFFEGLLEKKPDFIDALHALGDLYTRNRLYQKGLEVDRELEILCPDDPVVFYNLACSYSLLNRIDESYRTFKMAIRRGYDDVDHMEHDSDLDNLKKDSRFLRYYSKVKSRTLNIPHS